jgi:hypothetical protein
LGHGYFTLFFVVFVVFVHFHSSPFLFSSLLRITRHNQSVSRLPSRTTIRCKHLLLLLSAPTRESQYFKRMTSSKKAEDYLAEGKGVQNPAVLLARHLVWMLLG